LPKTPKGGWKRAVTLGSRKGHRGRTKAVYSPLKNAQNGTEKGKRKGLERSNACARLRGRQNKDLTGRGREWLGEISSTFTLTLYYNLAIPGFAAMQGRVTTGVNEKQGNSRCTLDINLTGINASSRGAREIRERKEMLKNSWGRFVKKKNFRKSHQVRWLIHKPRSAGD